MDCSLVQTITHAGFTEKEARVLLATFELGDGVAAAITKRAELNRSTTYLILLDLATKGFVTTLPRYKVKRFAAIDPVKLLQLSKEHTERFA